MYHVFKVPNLTKKTAKNRQNLLESLERLVLNQIFSQPTNFGRINGFTVLKFSKFSAAQILRETVSESKLEIQNEFKRFTSYLSKNVGAKFSLFHIVM